MATPAPREAPTNVQKRPGLLFSGGAEGGGWPGGRLEQFKMLGKIVRAIFGFCSASRAPGWPETDSSAKNDSQFRARDLSRRPGDPFRGHFPCMEKLLEPPPRFPIIYIYTHTLKHKNLPAQAPVDTISMNLWGRPGSPPPAPAPPGAPRAHPDSDRRDPRRRRLCSHGRPGRPVHSL